MLGKASLALVGSLSLASAQYKGFNWASSGNAQSNFEADFNAQASLPGASGFNSARLYTMIQDGTTDTPISAIPAAIASKTTLLLGLWASAGQDAFNNELNALKSAISQYGSDFADAVVGISVGSEDLYRDTYTSQVVNKDPNPGASPDTLADYISQVRKAISGTSLSSKPVGHVDTYTAYINGSNSALINAVDFCGMDAYPYYQTTVANGIDQAYDLFFSAYDQTASACGSKPVWVTETGWPYSGKQSNDAVASVENAQRYWDEVGCALFGKTNVWWFTLADGGSSPAFGIRGTSINNSPIFDLTCNSTSGKPPSSSSASSGSASKTGSTSVASATAPASGTKVSTTIETPVPSGGESGPATGASATATGSSGSGSGSGSSGSSGSGSGAGSAPAGTGSAGGAAGNGTASTTSKVSSSMFPGAAGRVEIGSFGAMILGLAAYLL